MNDLRFPTPPTTSPAATCAWAATWWPRSTSSGTGADSLGKLDFAAHHRRHRGVRDQRHLLLPVRRARPQVRRRLQLGQHGAALRRRQGRRVQLLDAQRTSSTTSPPRRASTSAKSTFPNYDETQEVYALFAQDGWRVSERFTLNYGLRWGKTDNPERPRAPLPRGQVHRRRRPLRAADRLRLADARRRFRRAARRRGPLLRPHAVAAVREPGPGERRLSELRAHHRDARAVGLRAARHADQQREPAAHHRSLDLVPRPRLRGRRVPAASTSATSAQLSTNWSAAIDLLYMEGKHLQRNYNDNVVVAGSRRVRPAGVSDGAGGSGPQHALRPPLRR